MNKTDTDLMRRIQELDFARVETQLFLDTHPDCRQALEYYHRLMRELEPLVVEYTAKHGPLTPSAVSTECWNWIDGMWPWQTENTEMREGKR